MVDDVAQKQEDIIGGLKNAMGRGETLDMARISFLNAGYPTQIVNMAANTFIQTPTVIQQQVPRGPTPNGNLNLYAKRTPILVPVSLNQKKGIFGSRVPYWVVIFMILISLGIVVGAGVMGLYWNRIF